MLHVSKFSKQSGQSGEMEERLDAKFLLDVLISYHFVMKALPLLA